METLKQLQPVLTVLQWAVAIGAAIFMLYMRSVFASKGDQAALQLRVAALEVANQLLTQQVGQSPSKEELHQLQIAMTELTGKLNVHNERMDGIEELHKTIKHQVQVMDGYLRERK